LTISRRLEQALVPAAIANWLAPALAVLFVLSVPLFLISANVRWIALNPSTYHEGFEKYAAAERTGLTPDQLADIGRAFIDYFQAPSGWLQPIVNLRGEQRPLFNEREVAHMQDVQKLMQFVFSLGFLAGVYLAVFSLVLLFWQRTTGLLVLGQLFLWAAGLSLALLVGVATLSVLDFRGLFILFHQASFRNELWMLDPRRDYLLLLFPQGFWLDATLKIAVMTAAESLALGAFGLFLVRR
jgi:integral membrane protein (TIGR01906 family)